MSKKYIYVAFFAFVSFGYLCGSQIATLIANAGLGIMAVLMFSDKDSLKDYLSLSFLVCILLYILDHQIIQDFGLFSSTYYRGLILLLNFVLNALVYWLGRRVNLDGKTSVYMRVFVPLGIVFGITIELLYIFICQKFSTQFKFSLIPILFYLVLSLGIIRIMQISLRNVNSKSK